MNHLRGMRSTRLTDIPVLLTEPTEKQAGRWAVLFHSAYECKEQMGESTFASLLSKQGFGVLIPDLPMHGERCADVPYNRDLHRLRVAGAMATELPRLLDAVGATSAMAIGGSLGGLCALAGLTTSEQVRVVVAYMTRVAWQPLAADGDEEDRRIACDLDPVRSAAAFADRKVLIVLGEDDGWASPGEVFPELEPIRAAATAGGGELAFEVIPRTGHWLPPAFSGRLVTWAASRLSA